MGVYPPAFVEQLKARGIRWFATATTVAEARAAEAAGADVIVAQGMEAGGHRGAFDAAKADTSMVGLFALLPAIVDAVDVPVVATGGIADARGVAAALILGASAVQIGTGFLRAPEAGLNPVWADALSAVAPEDTAPTRAFSGRLGRAIRTGYVEAAAQQPNHDQFVGASVFRRDRARQIFGPRGERFGRDHLINDIWSLWHAHPLYFHPFRNTWISSTTTIKTKNINAHTFRNPPTPVLRPTDV